VKKRAAGALIAVGLLLLLPGAVGLFDTDRLSSDEAVAALSPLARIPLDQLESAGSAAVVVTIPDNPQWKRIRRIWGDPDYLVAAVEYPQSARIIHCLDELEIHVDVIVKGVHVPLKPAQGWPYGYSGTSPPSGLELRAAPASDITIRATSPRHHMPIGELVLMCFWKNYVKDKLVGIYLDEDLLKISRITAPTGMLLIISGVVLLTRRRTEENPKPPVS
jgi:hypothetical protein